MTLIILFVMLSDVSNTSVVTVMPHSVNVNNYSTLSISNFTILRISDQNTAFSYNSIVAEYIFFRFTIDNGLFHQRSSQMSMNI